MIKHFYTDPLAAAWMAKCFGVRLLVTQNSDTNLDLAPYREEKWFEIARSAGIGLQANRYYIHPDSLHLLEPRCADKVSYSFGVGSHAGEAWDEVRGVVLSNDEGYPYVGNGEPYVLVDGCDAFPLTRLTNIFQRNGIAFHWPESDES